MKPKLLIATVTPDELKIKLPSQSDFRYPPNRGEVMGRVIIDFVGTNDFSAYVINGEFDKFKFYNDILIGDLELVGYKK